MADLQFNEEQQYARPTPTRKPSFMTGLVMRSGLAKDEAGAQRVLLIVLVLVILAIIAVNFF